MVGSLLSSFDMPPTVCIFSRRNCIEHTALCHPKGDHTARELSEQEPAVNQSCKKKF